MSGPKCGTVQLNADRALDIAIQSAQTRWNNNNNLNRSDFVAADSARRDAKSKSSSPDADAEVRDILREGERYCAEAKRLKDEAETHHRSAGRSPSTIEHAANLLRQSSEQLRMAKTAFEQSIILTEQKEETRRQFEMKRTATTNALQSVKNEATSFGEAFLGEWGGNTGLAKANQTLKSAENKLLAEQFEASQALSTKASEQFRELYDVAANNKRLFDSRQVIARAIVNALKDLEYDTPDVRDVPEDSIENKKLHSISIFAKSKGKVGDMRLVIDLSGKVDLAVADIPEGGEAACHNAITNLQSRVADIANLQITDWGRAEGYILGERTGIPKQTVQVKKQIKQGYK